MFFRVTLLFALAAAISPLYRYRPEQHLRSYASTGRNVGKGLARCAPGHGRRSPLAFAAR
jgi:hypothetical protein